MDEGAFLSQYVLMGWELYDKGQIRKRINNRDIIIICRINVAIVINSGFLKFTNQSNSKYTFEDVMGANHYGLSYISNKYLMTTLMMI